MKRLRSAALGLTAVALMLSGCAVIIERPLNASAVAATSAPASVVMRSLFSGPTSFQAWVAPLQGDGPIKVPGAWRDVTSDFTRASRNNDEVATGTLALPVGAHRFRAAACWFLGTNPSPTIPFNCQQAEVDLQAVPARLTVTLASIALDAGANVSVGVSATPPPGRDLTVTLASPRSASVSVTIAADVATAINASVVASTAGTSSLTASTSTPYAPASTPITVRPVASSLSPTSGPAGTQVTLTGAGFVAPASLRFGTIDAAATLTGSTVAKATVPVGLTGPLMVTMKSNGQDSSASLPFTIQALPVAGTLLFRSHATGIQTIRFTPGIAGAPGSFALVGAASVATTAPGLPVVGLTRAGSTLLRAGSQSLESFTIGGTLAAPTLAAAGATIATGAGSAALSGNGADAAFIPGAFIRGTDRGMEIYLAATSPLAKLGSVLNRPAVASAGISLLSHGPGAQVLRSTSNSLEVWDVANTAAPTVSHNNISVFTAPLGSGLAWLIPGQTLVRGFSSGIQVLTLSGGQTTVTGANNTGGAGSLQSVVAVSATRVARSTGMNVEIYDFSFGANPVRCATSNAGFASSTGVALAVDGTMLFRATNNGIEAWNLAALSCSSTPLSGTLPAPVQFTSGLMTATTGIGLAGPQ